MVRKNQIPQFPNDYLNEKAEEYDSSKWMERNQKRSTLLCIQYLFDEKLGDQGKNGFENRNNLLLLDLGCGTGFSSEILVGSGFKVIGVDVLPDMLLRAREKKRNLKEKQDLELILASINQLPIRGKKINHIISISAYNFIIYGKEDHNEKVNQLTETARYLHTILKKKGRIIIEFYPKDDHELKIFKNSFINNGFEGFMVKNNPKQKAGQTFLLLKKRI